MRRVELAALGQSAGRLGQNLQDSLNLLFLEAKVAVGSFGIPPALLIELEPAVFQL